MEKRELFRKSAIDSLSSPEGLNDYIRLFNPSVWVALAAVLALLAALFVWGFYGALPTTVSASGVASEVGEVVCFVSEKDAASLAVGMRGTVGGADASVKEIGKEPLSAAEAALAFNSDYARQQAQLGDWNIKITLQATQALETGRTYPVSITADEVRPIDFILN